MIVDFVIRVPDKRECFCSAYCADNKAHVHGFRSSLKNGSVDFTLC